VNFTKYGAEKLAHYVEHELRRVLNSHVVPVALPGPEDQTPAKGVGDAKPAVGPVVPLSTVSSEGGELLGSAKAAASKKEPDALATRVLSRGEALAAPHGRADDFSWPRADISSEPAPDTPLPPAASPSKGGTNKSETNKSETNKNETNKSEPNKGDANKAEPKKPAAPNGASNAAPNGAATGAPNATPNAAPARPRQTLDGGPVPRPPLPVGPAAAR